ncbi:hypothetical protein [Agreia sp. Leaf283]|uniref:hypothetical protein n=1 Tax=Agreia sp. Leaf283 TaxID=1736321 RepID=UPI0012F9B05D|nr:hypothetical protein [Agreia sp. Leaf283]
MLKNHDLIERATAVVSASYRGPQCVEASALLVEVGARLGYELEARPVSMFATNLTTGSEATGEQGRAFGRSFLLRRSVNLEINGFSGGSPFQRYAGHMIVVSVEHELLMDPTFAQFESLGPQAMPLFVQEARLRSDRYWQAGDDDFYVRYFRADDFMEVTFDAARKGLVDKADQIVAFMRDNPR